MLPLQFFGQNIHFAISLLTAMVFFAVFWLYFDAWISKTPKNNKQIYEWGGFLLVSLSFLVHATLIEQSSIGNSVLGGATETLSTILRLAGYAGIIIGQLLDPLQKKPHTQKLEDELKLSPAVAGGSNIFGGIYGLPLAALAIAVLYWRRATTGLEKHLRPVATVFSLLFGFELLSLSELWRSTSNPNLLPVNSTVLVH